MVNLRSYIDNVQKRIKPKFGEYMEMFVSLCGEKSPRAGELNEYITGNGSIVTTRKMACVINGCQKVFDKVLNYRLEFYKPCPNMMLDINRQFKLCMPEDNGNNFTEDGKNIVFSGGNELFNRFTHPDSHLALYTAMSEMLEHKVFYDFNVVTILMYMEAVAISCFNSVCDITNVSIVDMKSMISEARKGNGGKLIEYCSNNTISLGEY